MNTNVKHFSAGILLAVATAFSVPSLAVEPDDGVNRAVVKYGDLNLNHPDGIAALYRRLQAAAERVCGEPNERLLSRPTGNRACMHDAISRAVATIGSPGLTDYYAHKTGKSVRTERLASRP